MCSRIHRIYTSWATYFVVCSSVLWFGSVDQVLGQTDLVTNPGLDGPYTPDINGDVPDEWTGYSFSTVSGSRSGASGIVTMAFEQSDNAFYLGIRKMNTGITAGQKVVIEIVARKSGWDGATGGTLRVHSHDVGWFEVADVAELSSEWATYHLVYNYPNGDDSFSVAFQQSAVQGGPIAPGSPSVTIEFDKIALYDYADFVESRGGGPGGDCCCDECLGLLSSIAGNTEHLEAILSNMEGSLVDLHSLAIERNAVLSQQKAELQAANSTLGDVNANLDGLSLTVSEILGVAQAQQVSLGNLNTTLTAFASQNHTDLDAINAAILSGFDIPDNSAILQAIADNTAPNAAAAASLVSIDETATTISETLGEFAARDVARDAILQQILTAINNQSGGGGGGGDNSDIVDKLEEIKTALGDLPLLADIATDTGTIAAWELETKLDDVLTYLAWLPTIGADTFKIDQSLRNIWTGETAFEVLDEMRADAQNREIQLDEIIALLQAGNNGSGGSGDLGTTNALLEQIRVNTLNTANTTATMLLDWTQILNQIQSNTGSVSGSLNSINSKLTSMDYDIGLMKTNDLTRNSHLNSIKNQGYTAEQQREAMLAKWDEETAKQQQRSYTREGQLTGIKGELENIAGKLTGTAESGPEVPYAEPIEDNTGLETEVNSWTKAYDWLAGLTFTPTGQGSASEYTWFRFTMGTTLVTFKWPLELNDGLEWIGPIRMAIRTALTWLISISLYLKAFKVI